tara:strand:- start:7866 stop:8492 length:627 start_codon:yes stop_codon:yes gene_type:complete
MLDKEIQNTLDECMSYYTSEENLGFFHAAKKEFINLTGMINEEDDDFEHRVNSFHDWFLFHYELPEIKRITIKNFLLHNNKPRNVEKGILEAEYSIFEFLRDGKGESSFKNLLSGKEFSIREGMSKGTFVKGDIFLSHLIGARDDVFFSRGICLIPRSLKKTIAKEVEKNDLFNMRHAKNRFLFTLEKLKNKSKSYSHIPAEKIFVFN